MGAGTEICLLSSGIKFVWKILYKDTYLMYGNWFMGLDFKHAFNLTATQS